MKSQSVLDLGSHFHKGQTRRFRLLKRTTVDLSGLLVFQHGLFESTEVKKLPCLCQDSGVEYEQCAKVADSELHVLHIFERTQIYRERINACNTLAMYSHKLHDCS